MKWVYGILCLFFLILFHEIGHFLAARIFGVKVESFSIGFGPVLLHRSIKGTDYRISLFPLGGYCGMKGEKDFSKALEEKLPYIEADGDSLYGIHPLKRGAIGLAGPLFNLIFAVLAYSVISFTGYTYWTYSNRILIPEGAESPAETAGIKSGDRITEINGHATDDFSAVIRQVSVRPDENLEITVDRNGEMMTVHVHSMLDKDSGTGRIGVAADTSELLEKEAERRGFPGCLAAGLSESAETAIMTVKSLGILFRGVELKNTVSGPARVTDILGTAVQQGFSEGFRQGLAGMLSLMAVISLSLFIMNLLPVPVLDGGLILAAAAETVFRKKMNPKFMYYIQFIGLAFIAAVFIIGLAGDISYFISTGAGK